MEEKNNNFIKISVVLKSLAISICLTIFSIFILSVILCYSNFSEKIISSTLIIISSISIMIGCVFMEKKVKEKGLIYGGVFGFIYMIVLFLLSSFVSGDFSIQINSILMIIFGVLAGIFGGIMGVNFLR